MNKGGEFSPPFYVRTDGARIQSNTLYIAFQGGINLFLTQDKVVLIHMFRLLFCLISCKIKSKWWKVELSGVKWW